jgi:MFS family permease
MTEAVRASRFRWWVLLVTSVSAMCAMMNIISFSPLIGEIARSLKIDLGTASLGLVGAPTLATAIGIAISGFLIDSLGVFPVIIASQLLLIASTAAIPLYGDDYAVLFAIRIAQAFAGAGLTAAITPAIALWFPRHEMGRAMGFPSIGASVGTILGLNVAPMLSSVLGGWRRGTGVLSVVGLAALLLTLPIASRSKRERVYAVAEPGSDVALPTRQLYQLPTFWLGLLILALAMWANTAFGDLSPGFLAVAPPIGAGYGPRQAGLLMTATSITGIIGAPIAGFLVDKLFRGENRLVIMIGWGMSAVFFTAILIPAIHAHELALVAVLLLAGLQSPFVNVALLSFTAKVFPPQIVGRVCGLWISLSFFAGAAGVLVGSLLLHATGDYRASIIGLGLVSLIGLGLSILLKPPIAPLRHPDSGVTADPEAAR